MSDFQFGVLMVVLIMVLRELREGKDPRWVWTCVVWLWLGWAIGGLEPVKESWDSAFTRPTTGQRLR